MLRTGLTRWIRDFPMCNEGPIVPFTLFRGVLEPEGVAGVAAAKHKACMATE